MKAFLFLTGTLLISAAFAAIEIKTTSTQGDVQFDAIGKPSMLKIKGKGEGPIASLKIEGDVLNGDLKFNMTTLNSGIDLRDEHMKEKYLQVKEHPQATLTFKDFKMPAGWSLKNPTVKEAAFNGTMKLHGVEKPVTGTFQIDNEKLAGHANFDLNLSDFAIEIPSYLGVKVADTVKVAVNFTEMTASEIASVPAAKNEEVKATPTATPKKKKK